MVLTNSFVRLLDECVPKFPELWTLYSYRSEARMQLGRFKDAMEDAVRVLELNPNSAEVITHLDSLNSIRDIIELV